MNLGRIDCSLNLTEDKSVSRKHVEIRCQPGNVSLTDLESRFGTFVNGAKIEPLKPIDLKDGDCVKLGGLQSEFWYHSEGALINALLPFGLILV
jgi:pSer/pThr/pTyr-binding forkhead associated (FHA) protein